MPRWPPGSTSRAPAGTPTSASHIDIPERRSDLVDGNYELEAPEAGRPAAVRITDMLGEEILIVEDQA